MLGVTPTLRTAALGCRMQPTLFTPCAYHTIIPRKPTSPSTSSTRQLSTIRRVTSPKRNVILPSQSSRNTQILRHASTTAPSPLPTSSTPTPPQKLDWNTFFKLRKTRRWYQLGSSIFTSSTFFIGGAQLLTMTDMDFIAAQLPLDPFIGFGLIVFAFGGVGWLLGPVLGTSLFQLRNKGVRAQMAEKEKAFYHRVRKWRVDPSASSMANPVPDYHGEKISSVAGYRQWLKDQRAFNKKRATYIK